ncbi:MAG: hypothetical protein WDA60_05025, partial [Acidimicrobiia bacterium]
MIDEELLCLSCAARARSPAADVSALGSISNEVAHGFAALSGVERGVSHEVGRHPSGYRSSSPS